MAELHQQLQEKERVAIAPVTGMGGIGKTELALQYALQYRKQDYPGGLCWLQARDVDLATQIIDYTRIQLNLKIPEELTIEQQIAYCWRNWSFLGDVLVIFDDVTSYQTIEPYLPPNESRFKIIVTTRVKKLAQSFVSLELEVLSEEGALDLLKSLITPNRVEKEAAEAKILCHQLGYLPLGLELVGQYLAQRADLSLAKMQKRLKNKGLEQKALQKHTTKATAEKGVKAAFELSWQELNDPAQQLACFLSLFALAPISWSLVEQCLPDQDEEDLEETRDDMLVKYSLVKRNEAGIYQFHQLIRQYFQDKWQEIPEAEKLKRQFCQGMVIEAQKISDTPTREDIEAVTLSIPHLAETASQMQQWLDNKDLTWPFLGLARFYEGQGQYQLAEPWYKQCLDEAISCLEEEHPLVASSLNNLAGLYNNQGRYEDAQPLFQQALDMRRKVLGSEHPDVTISLNNLALSYHYQGRYEEAEPLFQQALNLRRKLLGSEHPYVATSLNNLAKLYNDQGRYDDAQPLYQQALDMRRKLLGAEHLYVAQSLNNLAGLYNAQGRYEEAEPLFQQALDLTRKVLGEEHPYVAFSLNNLALSYHYQGRYEEAEPLYQQALDLRRKLLREEHPYVAFSLNNLAVFYRTQGRYEEAEPLFQQALDLRRKLLGDEHPYVAFSLNNLALLYNDQGRHEKAEPLYKQAIAIATKTLGEEHPNTVVFTQNYEQMKKNRAKKNKDVI